MYGDLTFLLLRWMQKAYSTHVATNARLIFYASTSTDRTTVVLNYQDLKKHSRAKFVSDKAKKDLKEARQQP